jgi:hypothetical protein
VLKNKKRQTVTAVFSQAAVPPKRHRNRVVGADSKKETSKKTAIQNLKANAKELSPP